jgi:hypothetical protein
MLKKLFSFFALFAIFFSVDAKEIDSLFFRALEERLILLHREITSLQGAEKRTKELAFRDSLLLVLKTKDAEYFPFDSLKMIGRVTSEKEELTVFSWNIPQAGGFHNYYCILRYFNKKEKKHTFTILEENHGFLNQSPQHPASSNNWPGALYYNIITTKYKGITYYTLIGFDFNNLISNRKVIEVISYDEYGYLNFPVQNFIYEGKPQNRMVFEYAERVQMVIDYDEKNKMIVHDHLSPFKPSLEGQYQFYGPDFSYDGFLFEDGVWKQMKNITPEN